MLGLAHFLLWQKFICRERKWDTEQVDGDEGSLEQRPAPESAVENKPTGVLPPPHHFCFCPPSSYIMFFFSTHKHLLFIYILFYGLCPLNKWKHHEKMKLDNQEQWLDLLTTQ